VDFGDDVGGFSDFFRTIFGGGFGGGGPEGGGYVNFEEMFGRGAGRGAGRPPMGQDVEAEVELTLDEVLRGTPRSVRLGEASDTRTVEIKIPPGVREGARLRASGEGAGAPGGPRGDLYLRVRVLPHPQFERKGDDLHTGVTVPLTTAVLGGETEVPTLEGPLGIKVPAGSKPGRVFRLRGKGLPRMESPSQRGDLFATLQVDLPAQLTPRAQELFEELKQQGM
jgi:curved DNA-binding protein